MATRSKSTRHLDDRDETAVRRRILEAAFAAFMKNGYAATSTLEIATRARVSKRDLYALVGESLGRLLYSFGARLLREVSEPKVIAVFRLAIAEATNAPEVARTLDSTGREAGRTALRNIMQQAQTSGLLDGRPAELAEQFRGLLWRDLMVSLLLGVAERPNEREIERRARDAAAAFLNLHP